MVIILILLLWQINEEHLIFFLTDLFSFIPAIFILILF